MDPFWADRPSILIERDRLMEFVPTNVMTTEEKLNALSRFLLYSGVLLVLIYENLNMIYVTLVGLTLMYLIYQHYPNLQKGGNRDGVNDGAPTPMTFTGSTPSNPFMNVLLSDYVHDSNRGPADIITKEGVERQVDSNFNKGLYRDVDDIWDRANSQRQYYTMPATTIPNDQGGFAKWLYGSPASCREGNMERCLKYEDVRQHGHI